MAYGHSYLVFSLTQNKGDRCEEGNKGGTNHSFRAIRCWSPGIRCTCDDSSGRLQASTWCHYTQLVYQ